MQDDTFIGGQHDRFPLTQMSAIVAVASADEQVRSHAFESIITAYWRPVYKYIRFKWHSSNEDAKDLTQAFFTRVMEKDFFEGYDARQSRFRSFLRVCLDRFVANEYKSASRIKRGGDSHFVSLDFESADGELLSEALPSPDSIEDYFTREWAREIFSLAVAHLKAEYESAGKTTQFRLFERYHLSDDIRDLRLSYDRLAEQYNLPVSAVTNYLSSARREFRRIVLEDLRSLTATPEEFRQEARELLGRGFKGQDE